ncbi:hypothetical protein ABGB18_32455 [Nonomuraea sp. B12E4]|uniref:hypothetical protein n=1 Tax=Nonomuraea sp. B12E4 TaxID=3153564 RepID=UPI00325E6682
MGHEVGRRQGLPRAPPFPGPGDVAGSRPRSASTDGAPLLPPKDRAGRIAAARAAAAELLAGGTYESLARGLDYGTLNAALTAQA